MESSHWDDPGAEPELSRDVQFKMAVRMTQLASLAPGEPILEGAGNAVAVRKP